MAGKGGLNITHAEAHDAFLARYGARRPNVEPLLNGFSPAALREWVGGLGVETFIGSSGRVFPTGMKAHRCCENGCTACVTRARKFHVRHRWLGWREDGALNFATPQGEQSAHADVVILALGGGSWARLRIGCRLGAGARTTRIQITPLQSANCGFDIGWSEHFRSRFAGSLFKSVVASFTDSCGITHLRHGECIITDGGIEGGLVYALCAPLRDEIADRGAAVIHLDLLPGRDRNACSRRSPIRAARNPCPPICKATWASKA